jgi:hypothetical protein
VTPAESARIAADALLASFKEMKTEISRRSSLSWTAAAGYLVVLYSAAKDVAEGKHLFGWPLAIWLVSIATYLFVFSQYAVIMSLSDHIKYSIENSLNQICGYSSLLGERAGAQNTNVQRAASVLANGKILLFTAFVAAPLALNLAALCQGGPCAKLMVLSSAGILVSTVALFVAPMDPP